MLRTAAALGITPEAFWRLSLREWRMLVEAPAGAAPLGRAGLERMMEGWPDGG
jgi:uncharacterized phage protein (TIGR02216 family)